MRPTASRRVRRGRRGGVAALAFALSALTVVVAACSGAGTPAAPTTTTTTVKPGLNLATASGVPLLRHVFVIVLENTSYEDVMGPQGVTDAPYFHSLASQGVSLGAMYGVAHNSLPNYIAMTSGIGPTARTKSDCITSYCPFPPGKDSNLADQLERANLGWHAYMEDMPAPCTHGEPGKSDPYVVGYATRHNPFLYYADIIDNRARCEANDVPYSQFAQDRERGQTAAYSLIVPSTCDDAHDGGDKCGLATADRWLSENVPPILASNDYASGGMLVITFDESDTSDTRGCCGNAEGGRIATLVLSPVIAHPGTDSTVPYSHYSLLRTIEDAFKLKCLGHACDAGTKAFGEDVWGKRTS